MAAKISEPDKRFTAHFCSFCQIFSQEGKEKKNDTKEKIKFQKNTSTGGAIKD